MISHNDKNSIDNNNNNNNNYQINLSGEIPIKKRRRTVNKLSNDPENLPLCDLLFYNPPETIFQKESRKLKEDEDPIEKLPKLCSIKRRSSRSSSVSSDQSNKDRVKQIIKNVESTTNETNNSLTVQSSTETQTNIDDESSDEKINPSNIDDKNNQMLVIDESGIIVFKNPNQSSSIIETKQNIVHAKSSTTYKSFRKEKPKSAWNAEETGIFYTALELVGTDFSLMEAVFFKNTNRDRKQLKQKFKREEKVNRDYIDKILYKSLCNRSKIKLINGQLIKENDRTDINESALPPAT